MNHEKMREAIFDVLDYFGAGEGVGFTDGDLDYIIEATFDDKILYVDCSLGQHGRDPHDERCIGYVVVFPNEGD